MAECIYMGVDTSDSLSLSVAKWGNSLAVRLPAELVRRFALRAGDSVQARLTADGALVIRPAGFSRRAFAAELDTARRALPLGPSVIAELREQERY